VPTRLPGGRASHWHAGGAPLAATAACGDPGPGTGICVGQWQGRGRRLADSASASFGQLPAPDAAARCCRAPYTSARAWQTEPTTGHLETRDLPGANPAPACCSYRDRVASVDRGGLLKLRFVLFGSNFQVAGVRRIIIRPECALLSRVRAGCSRTTHMSNQHGGCCRACSLEGPSLGYSQAPGGRNAESQPGSRTPHSQVCARALGARASIADVMTSCQSPRGLPVPLGWLSI
jgi:hypothetical protein